MSTSGLPFPALVRLFASFLCLQSFALAENAAPTAANAAPIASEQLFVDDDAIVQHIEEEGNALVRTGKTVRLKALRAQMAKVHTCAVNLPPPDAPPQTPREMFERRARGVLVVGVLIHQKKKQKLQLAGCTGFALTPDGLFVTNYHVVDNPDGDTIVVMTHDGQITPVTEVLAADKLTDVAILRAPGAIFTPLPLAKDVPAIGAPIWVISHPDHNFYSFTAGMVSRHFVADTEDGRTPQMAITADFGQGSSGGPILDVRGQVTGIVCSTTSVYWEDEKAKISDLQMVFKHCVPVYSIRQLIEPPHEAAAAASSTGAGAKP